MKETPKCKYYYRYCDDIVVLSDDKCFLHNVFNKANAYLRYNNLLTIKSNYQIFPITARGIDFLGYVFYNGYTLLRKSMKNRFKKKVRDIYMHYKNTPKTKIVNSITSYYGWLKSANTHSLWNKYIDYDMHVILLNNGLTKRRTL